jgi:4-carboxymuconolactone decarboxylase
MAIRQGWTETELREAILHLSVYVGLPLVREAMLTAGETFAAIRAEG